MTAPSVSVIVPAHDAALTVGHCVAALCRQEFDRPYEIIVVDDGSTDDTAAVAKAAGAVILSTRRGRPAAARNTGIRAAHGEIICFTDADCFPLKDWLQQITAPLVDPCVVACKGSYITRQTSLVARFVQLEYEDKYDLLRPQPSIDFIDTYSAAYRRDVLLANNGFDERFLYLEDQELSFRLADLGSRMVFQEAAIVEHLHSASLRAYLRKKALIGYWKAQVVRAYPRRLVRDSHTPQVMKVQMALAALLLALVAAWLAGLFLDTVWLARAGGLGALACLIIFLATTLPFLSKAWRKDRAICFIAPALLFGRALALGMGYAWGVIRPHGGLEDG